MKTSLNMKATLLTATDQSAGAWTTVRVVFSVADATGVYTALDVSVGDILVFDTSAYSSGTASKYVVASVVSRSGQTVTANATYSSDNAPEPAPDLSYSEGTVGLIGRPTQTRQLTTLPSPSVQQVPESLVTATINSDHRYIVDAISGGGGGSATNLSFTANATGATIASSTGTSATATLADGTNAGLMSPAQVTKLAGIAVGATAVAVANNLTTSTAGDALDATQGKVLKDAADALAVTVSGKQATLVSGTNIKTLNSTSLLGAGDISVVQSVNGLSPDGSGNVVSRSFTAGTVGATPIVISLATYGLVGAPHTVTVAPDTGCTLRIESSTNGGSTYSVVDSGTTTPSYYQYLLQPGDTAATHLRITLTAGASANSTYSVSGGVDYAQYPAGTAVSNGSTNLSYTALPSGITVNSSTGAGATLPLADATNAGLMSPAQVTKLAGVAAGATAVSVANNLTTSTTGFALDATQGKALKDTADALATTVSGKQDTLVSGTNIKTVNSTSLLGAGDLAVATAAQGALAGTALQPGGQLTQSVVNNSTALGAALFTSDLVSAHTALDLGTAASLDAATIVQSVNGVAPDGAGNVSTRQNTNGTIGASPVVLSLATYGLVGNLHTLVVVPDTGCTLTVEYSSDGGSSYNNVAVVTTTGRWDYVRQPSETAATHIRLSRTGASVASTYSLG